MNITVIGTGYVGLVTGACLAELGNQVTCVDINEDKIAKLNQGIMPIYEPGLETMVKHNVTEGRMHFITGISDQIAKTQVYYIAVGTPSGEDGSANLDYVIQAARDIGNYINDYVVVVNKSTVPVGSGDRVKTAIKEQLAKRNTELTFDVVSNPEFLREGAAISDFMQPDRVVIGSESDKATEIMRAIYNPLVRNPEKILFMKVKDAEMSKYVANALLATKISFMNEMASLCDRMGVDVENIRLGIGSDSRIGYSFINPGCGYGGSCFPKDVRALVKMAQEYEIDPIILHAIEERNHRQKQVMHNKLMSLLGDDLSSCTIALWGLSFKPGTDDMREASSIVFLDNVIARGATVKAYDPVAMDMAREILPKKWFTSQKLQLMEDQYDVLDHVDALALITEWQSFCLPDLELMKKRMRRHLILDGRNQYDPKRMKESGFEYYGIGRS